MGCVNCALDWTVALIMHLSNKSYSTDHVGADGVGAKGVGAKEFGAMVCRSIRENFGVVVVVVFAAGVAVVVIIIVVEKER